MNILLWEVFAILPSQARHMQSASLPVANNSIAEGVESKIWDHCECMGTRPTIWITTHFISMVVLGTFGTTFLDSDVTHDRLYNRWLVPWYTNYEDQLWIFNHISCSPRERRQRLYKDVYNFHNLKIHFKCELLDKMIAPIYDNGYKVQAGSSSMVFNRILHINKYTANVFTYWGLGRFSLTVNSYLKSIKYR